MELRVLYISYDGATEPLGRSQVLPYLKGLAKRGNEFILISYEKKQRLRNKSQVHKLKSKLHENKIRWIALKYHKNPPVLSTLYDVLKGIAISWHLTIQGRIQIIHARSYIPALIAFSLKKILGTKFLFDMRGFWPEERLEGKIWKNGRFLYHMAKYFEKKFMLHADEIVVLTEESKKIIRAFPYLKRKNLSITTIPTCVDLNAFRLSYPKKEIFMKLKNKYIMVYIGSIGTWYMLKEMTDFFKRLRVKEDKAFFLFLSSGEESYIKNQMHQANIPEDCFLINEVSHDDVPKWLATAAMSIFFIRPSFSKKGSCPTKLGESLACGLPIIINSGIGDTEEITIQERIGVVLNEFTDQAYNKAIDQMDQLLSEGDALKQRCRSAAEKYFSLDKGIKKYWTIYQNLTEA